MKFIIFFLFFVSVLCQAQAEDTIDVQASKNTIIPGESFELRIDLSELSGGEVSIPGIEKFQLFSQSQSSSFQNINGQIDEKKRIILTLSAQEKGDYTLGPVSLKKGSGSIVDDEIIKIHIDDFASQNLSQNDEKNEKTLEENRQKEIKEELPTGLRKIYQPYIFFMIGMCSIFLILFFLLKSFFETYRSQKKTSQKREKSPSLSHKTISPLKQKFLLFQKQKDVFSSHDFLKKSLELLRDYYSYNGGMLGESASLAELDRDEKFQNFSGKNLFEKLYHFYFSEYHLSAQERDLIFSDLQTFFSDL